VPTLKVLKTRTAIQNAYKIALADTARYKGLYLLKNGVQLFIGNPSQSYGASPAVRDHTVLPATRQR